MLKPGAPARPRLPGRARARWRPTAARWWPTARCCRSRRSTSRRTAGSTCTSRCCPPGAARRPVQHAIWAGDEVTGATTFRHRQGARRRPDVRRDDRARSGPTDTAGDLLGRLAEGGAGLLVATLDGIEDGSLEARAAAGGRASASPPRSPSTTPASTGPSRPSPSTGRIRACTPAPGRLDDARRASGSSSARCTPDPTAASPPGRARGRQERRRTSAPAPPPSGSARSRRSGSKQMAAADWARGVRVGRGRPLRGREASERRVRPATPTTSTRSASALPEAELGIIVGRPADVEGARRARRARASCSTGCPTRPRSTPRPGRCTTTCS